MATPRKPRKPPKPSKPKPSTLARRGRKDPLSKNKWVNVSENVKKKINSAARSAALSTMNGLAEKGPAYSGDFRDSWVANAIGGIGKNQPAPAGYPYRIQDIPQLKTTVKAMQRVTVFEIVNTSPYALYAMDILEGRWIKPKTPEKPVGGIEFKPVYGVREKGPTFRWQVKPDPEGTNVSTAERDWYENYARGGEMSADVKRVVRLAFRAGDNGGGR